MRRHPGWVVVAIVLITGTVSARGADPAALGPGALSVPDPASLPDTQQNRLVRRGHDLIVRTASLIGPLAADPARRFAGNSLNCQSCHLDGGTRPFALPLIGVVEDFPQYRARSGKIDTIEDRINGCLSRSLNGRPMPNPDPDMIAMVAYLRFLSSTHPAGQPVPGRGLPRMAELSRPADPDRGKAVYDQHCAVCHGADGQGQRASPPDENEGYVIPPLWGPDSYNQGAGMARLITAANFIRANMPRGTTWQSPILRAADAWDVAAFVNAQPRPGFRDAARDYPALNEKPVDAPYGPWADGLPAQMHRLGPFEPIRRAQSRGPNPKP